MEARASRAIRPTPLLAAVTRALQELMTTPPYAIVGVIELNTLSDNAVT